jgi:hypothetical protein
MEDFEKVGLGIFAVIVIYALWLIFAGSALERQCLRAGYPEASLRLIGPNYCIKRVDQTDVVIPADSVK